MKTRNLTLSLLLFLPLSCSTLWAQDSLRHCQAPAGKEIYIPEEFKNDDFTSAQSKYSFCRMAYTDDIVAFWEKPFGDDLTKSPSLNGHDMTVDVQALLKAAQRFYTYYKDTLHFITPGSIADKYRMMIMIMYSEDGTAYGGAYDNKIGALWVTPLRLHEKKYNCIAHELGHSFQAQIGADGVTSAGGGGLWEYTSQWMLWHVNPLWMTDENYHWVEFMKKTHLALFSPENMYRGPYMMEYWSNKRGLEIITRIWREGKPGEDAVECYKRLTGIDQAQLNDEVFDAAQRFITYDLDRIRTVARPYANKHTSTLKHLVYDWYGIDADRVPEDYGYNGIELALPEKGKKVTLSLEGTLPEGVTGEWKYALLPVENDTIPHYDAALQATTVKGHGKTLTFKMPKKQNITHLWLVVSTAPDKHNASEVSQWPYRVKLDGTTPLK